MAEARALAEKRRKCKSKKARPEEEKAALASMRGGGPRSVARLGCPREKKAEDLAKILLPAKTNVATMRLTKRLPCSW